MDSGLKYRDTLLWLAIGAGSWGISALYISWWQGLVGITLSALILAYRATLKESKESK